MTSIPSGIATDIELSSAIAAHTTDAVDAHLDSAVGADRIGSPTYQSVRDILSTRGSSGTISGGAVTDAGGETINVAAGQGMIRTSNSSLAPLKSFAWSASNGLAIPTNTVRWVGVDYNAGSPIVALHTADDFNYNTDFPLKIVVNQGGVLHLHDGEHIVNDFISNSMKRSAAINPLARDEKTGGLIIAESGDGNRYVSMTAGALWARSRIAINAMNTSGSDRFTLYSVNAGTWTATGSQQVWPNTQYNNIASGLVTLDNNKYACLWVYIEADNDLAIVYGRSQYNTPTSAEAEVPPTTLPSLLQYESKLIGRIIFQKSATTATSVSSVFSTAFSAIGILTAEGVTTTASGSLSGLTVAAQLAELDSEKQSIANNVTGNFTASQSLTTTGQLVNTDNATKWVVYKGPDTMDIDGSGKFVVSHGNTTSTIYTATLNGSRLSRTLNMSPSSYIRLNATITGTNVTDPGWLQVMCCFAGGIPFDYTGYTYIGTFLAATSVVGIETINNVSNTYDSTVIDASYWSAGTELRVTLYEDGRWFSEFRKVGDVSWTTSSVRMNLGFKPTMAFLGVAHGGNAIGTSTYNYDNVSIEVG